MTDTQFDRWRHAVAGNKLDCGARGDPPSGYYRRNAGAKGWEAICVYRDADGAMVCIRNIFGNGAGMTVEEIDELFASEIYPVPYDVYRAVEGGADWPPEYTTRLTLAEIKAGVPWTPELGRGRIGVKEIEPTPPGLGHNNPPEELTPDRALAKRIFNLGAQLGEWLKSIGGAARTQAEAEMLGSYANKFKDCENEAVAAHKVEKQPHLDAGRAVDAKWFGPVRDKAIASRDKVITLVRTFEKAEDARRADEARIANEAARKAAQSQERTTDAPAEPIVEVAPEPTRVTTLRGGGRRPAEPLVKDLGKFLAYCASLENPPPDIVEAAEKVARKWKSTGVNAPGMSEEKAA